MQFNKIFKAITQKKQRTIGWFILFAIIQSFFSIYGLIRIPVDPKNVAVLGLTRGRLALIVFILGLDVLGVLILRSFSRLRDYFKSHLGYTKLKQVLQNIAIILMLVLWITLWLPAYRLGEYFEEYERLRPFLLWLGAVGCELFVLLRIFSLEKSRTLRDRKISSFRKPFLLSLLLTLCFAGLYFYLRNNLSLSTGIIEPASTPITPMQLFVMWVIVIFIFIIGTKSSLFLKPAVVLITAAIIYILSCIIFLTIPLACKGDLVGIYPPNFTCYPDIHDAVFHVGSLYTYYGEGILNQWFTDKPVYMLFLSLCQWIAGIQIQEYMTVQVIFLSFLPAAVFLLVRKMADYSSALLASLLSIVAQYNSIHLYSKLGGVNIRIAASEILTALLLIFTTRAIFKWFRQPNKLSLSLTTGLMLGLTVLTRFNAIMIIPVIVLVVTIFYLKKKYLGLRALASFGAGLVITLLPWFFLTPIVNHDTVNPYLEKIQNEFVNRTGDSAGLIMMGETSTAVLIDNNQVYENPIKKNPATGSINDPAQGFPERVSLHYVNNLLSAFFSLPVNSGFYDSQTITEQSYWSRDSQPIWQREMSLENLSLWSLSILLIILGIWQSWRCWGLSGLSPLLVFLGYLLGNAVALTSGGRYLTPVLWVVFLYFSLGIMRITRMIIAKLGFEIYEGMEKENNPNLNIKLSGIRAFLNTKGTRLAATVLLILPAIALPFFQVIPDRLPPERTSQTEQLVYTYLQNDLDSSTWDAFLAEDDSVILEGVLFYPQYYNQSRYLFSTGKNVFEALILGRDYVYMSYLWEIKPDFITDGSEVLIAACIKKEGPSWGMERRIVRAFAIIQLNNEENIYLDPQATWTCQ